VLAPSPSVVEDFWTVVISLSLNLLLQGRLDCALPLRLVLDVIKSHINEPFVGFLFRRTTFLPTMYDVQVAIA
jgi:hypothetical protein